MKREESLWKQNGQRTWTRRELLRGAGTVAALSPLRGALAAQLLKPMTFAYVAASGAGDAGFVNVFAVVGGIWSRVQRVSSRAPSCLVLSQDQRVLYVANDIAQDAGLPRGTVEAFSVASNGRLTSLGVRPLALSGTHPRAMALSPDGKVLVVAAYGGGLYSVLPVAPDGRLGAAKHSYKQTGSGPHSVMQRSAHPHSLMFDPQSGRLLASDFGADRLNSFSIDGQKLRWRTKQSTGVGSGPGAFVLHSQAATIFAAHELEGSLVSYRYDGTGDALAQVVHRVEGTKLCGGHAKACLALHASGRMLYSGSARDGELLMWRIGAQTGRLAKPRAFPLPTTRLSQLLAAPDGKGLLVVDDDTIHRVATESVNGEMNATEKVARVENAKFVALKIC